MLLGEYIEKLISIMSIAGLYKMNNIFLFFFHSDKVTFQVSCVSIEMLPERIIDSQQNQRKCKDAPEKGESIFQEKNWHNFGILARCETTRNSYLPDFISGLTSMLNQVKFLTISKPVCYEKLCLNIRHYIHIFLTLLLSCWLALCQPPSNHSRSS
jgi:hypothetical protein